MNSVKPLFTRKAIAIAVGLLVIGTAGTLSINSRASKAPAAAAAPAAVSVAAVVEKSVIEWDDFSGRVEAIERVEIRPRVAGTKLTCAVVWPPAGTSIQTSVLSAAAVWPGATSASNAQYDILGRTFRAGINFKF